MLDLFRITWRGDKPEGWQGPPHYIPSPDYPGYMREGEREGIAQGTSPDDWQSHFIASSELRQRLAREGWRNVRSISIRRIPRRELIEA